MQMETGTETVADTARHEIDDAKARLSSAAEAVRREVRTGGSTISAMVMDELDRRTADLGSDLRNVARRMRTAAEEEAGDGPSARLLIPAIDLMEDASHRLEGRSARQIGEAIASFGRENPMLFMLGCLATGVVAGRLVAAADTDQGMTGSEESFGKDQTEGYRAGEFTSVYGEGRNSGGPDGADKSGWQDSGGREATGFARDTFAEEDEEDFRDV
jgi:hypothetical protein